MSAGVFIYEQYEDDKGFVHPIKVQPETIAAVLGGTANASPGTPIDANDFVRVGGGRRGYGIKARLARLAWTGAPPLGYKVGGTVTIPILSLALWNTLSSANTTGTYLGAGVKVVGLSSQAGR